MHLLKIRVQSAYVNRKIEQQSIQNLSDDEHAYFQSSALFMHSTYEFLKDKGDLSTNSLAPRPEVSRTFHDTLPQPIVI